MEKTINTKLHEDFLIEDGTGKNERRILLAENDENIRSALRHALQGAGYKTIVCRDGLDLLSHIRSFLFPIPERTESVDLIISDIFLPGVTGLEILEGIQSIEAFPPIILITEFNSEKTGTNIERLGAAAIFEKPFDTDELLSKVNHICAALKSNPIENDNNGNVSHHYY